MDNPQPGPSGIKKKMSIAEMRAVLSGKSVLDVNSDEDEFLPKGKKTKNTVSQRRFLTETFH